MDMNNLSWFIYLADTIPAIGKVFAFSSFMCFTVTLCYAAAFCVEKDSTSSFVDESKLKCKKLFKNGIIAAILSLLLAFACSLIPSKNTIILIGASEFGEKLARSEAVSGIVDPSIELLKAWIEQQTKQIRDSK